MVYLEERREQERREARRPPDVPRKTRMKNEVAVVLATKTTEFPRWLRVRTDLPLIASNCVCPLKLLSGSRPPGRFLLAVRGSSDDRPLDQAKRLCESSVD